MITRRRQRGLAMVEFAVSVPLLLMLLIAVAEISRAFVQYAQLAHSVRDAVRHLAGRALLGTTGVVNINATLNTQIRNLVVYGNTTGSGSAILPGLVVGQVTVSDAGGGNVRVVVNYPFQSLFGGTIPSFGFGSSTSTNFTLTVDNTMRAL